MSRKGVCTRTSIAKLGKSLHDKGIFGDDEIRGISEIADWT